MRNILCISIVLVIVSVNNLLAQTDKYWQQIVNNKINVLLDDKLHQLKGNIEIEYINQSPDTLSIIYFNLFPNSYSSIKSYFSKQKIQNGDLDFYYSDYSEKGFIDSLDFIISNERVVIKYLNESKDIAQLILNKKLLPNEKIIIQTNFKVQLPKTFSRGGHIGQSYQITQWFPKPTVYDKKGWHPLPYLDQGEFYSEFGNYNVTITLPENYWVAATGYLQDDTEMERIEAVVSRTKNKIGLSKNSDWKNIIGDKLQSGFSIIDNDTFPKSSTINKTLHFTAQNVHDFAFFADKRFNILKSSVNLPNSRKTVTTWAYFLDDRIKYWKKATQYIDSSLYYYSKWVGDYEYNQATAVEGALSAGGGMEYPMITVIADVSSDKGLETVITHEVGHNWFQGMLAFNERDYPWMDEGINSYYENRYINLRYPDSDILSKGISSFFGIDKVDDDYLFLNFQDRRHQSQPCCLRSSDFSSINYGAMIYSKVPYSFRYLENYLGTTTYDKVMQKFFKEWKLKHPQPDDLQNAFKETGIELDWFFNDLLCSTKKLDYKIKSAKDTVKIGDKLFQELTIKNIGKIKGPYSISAYKRNTSEITNQWFGGFLGTNNILIPYDSYYQYRIDANELIPEFRRSNNTLRSKGIMKKCEPLRIQPFFSLENPYRKVLYVAPAIGFNNYDKLSVGLTMYNSLIPVKNVEWVITPMYSTNTNRLRGMARIQAYFFPKNGIIKEILWRNNFSIFAYDEDKFAAGDDISDTTSATNYYNDVFRYTNSLIFRFDNSKKINHESLISFRYLYIRSNYTKLEPVINTNYLSVTQLYNENQYIEFKYTFNNKSKLNPNSFSSSILSEFNNSNGLNRFNVELEFNQRLNYNKRKGLDIRLYATATPKNQFQYLSADVSGSDNKATDFTFDHYFLGRSVTTGLFSKQFSPGGGNLKFNSSQLLVPIGLAQYIVTLNLKSQLPIPLLFLFSDIGFNKNPFPNTFNLYKSIQYDAGVGITIIPKFCEIFLPLLVSDDIKKNIYTIPNNNKWYERIMFTLQLENLDVFEKVRRVNL
jgi:hypothetical protein